ncbi:MAG: SH3 domain-containing protein [Alphaproteobacteria bacterium]|nr:SH3 domain-containing protein [Alphaproteobacteria bacterium]
MTANRTAILPAHRGAPWFGAALIAAVLCAPIAEATGPAIGAAEETPFLRPVAGNKPGKPQGVKRTGLPLPRFASLRAGEVNLRAGPGVRYPVEWVYQRRGLPVMITAEFDAWRKIRDWRGTVGWIHRSMLTGKRAVIVTAREVVLRRKPADDAPAVARAASGVIARVLACEKTWCRIEAGGIRGWARRAHLWGTLKGEKIK